LLLDAEQVNDSSSRRFTIFRPMMRRALLCGAALLAAGCHHDPPATPPEPKLMPATPLALSATATQHIVLLPSFGMSVAPNVPVAWRAGIGQGDDVLRSLDSSIARTLDDRGLHRAWIFPADLERTFRREPTYAPDPRLLFEIPLLAVNLAVGATAPSELADQLSRLIRFHEGARFVLAPVGLRFEATPAGLAGARIRLVLIDGRTGEVNWIGDISGDVSPTFAPVVLTSLGDRIAGLIVGP
jgi:hypothetical protein